MKYFIGSLRAKSRDWLWLELSAVISLWLRDSLLLLLLSILFIFQFSSSVSIVPTTRMDLSKGFSEVQSNVQILLKSSENSALKFSSWRLDTAECLGRHAPLTWLEKIVKIVIKWSDPSQSSSPSYTILNYRYLHVDLKWWPGWL